MKKIVTLNDRTLAVYFEEEISMKINKLVLALCHEIEKLNLEAILAIQHTYHMVAIHYNPNLIDDDQLRAIILQMNLENYRVELNETAIRIPVLYDGPDLEIVAKHNELSIEEVINIHSGAKYYVYFLGFSAGFPYLGGLDNRISTPRLKTPRLKVPTGSVGIADQQTGIYTVSSPGGWNIIGRTPVKMFDITRSEACILHGGSYVEFYPIDLETFVRLEKGDVID